MSPDAALTALRAAGADRVDPVRFRTIEALARRAAAHDGPVRAVLDDKLASLLAACQARLSQPQATAGDDAPRSPGAAALTELLGHIARQSSPTGFNAAPAGSTAAPSPPPELKALGQVRQTWSRLNAARQLAQSRALVPDNAGPLNSHQLVHQSLKLMHALSPDYLERFMAHVDTLSWLERLSSVKPASSRRS